MTPSKSLILLSAAAALLLALALALQTFGSPARAEPELEESYPQAGAVLDLEGEDTGFAAAPGADGDDDGLDILLKALITTAAIGGAVVLATLLYLVRRWIGFDLHRPPEGGEGEGNEH